MASGTTDRGKKLLLDYAFEASTVPTTYYLALCTSAVTPTKAINTFSQMTEIAAGQGYTTGGASLTAATDFTVTEVDSTVGAKVVIADTTFTASGGNLPASGDGARWAVLLDGAVSGSNVLAYFDLVSDRTVSDTQTLTIQAAEIDANEP
jgi:hypothetical protein|tara:strand:+ start:4185 stop:4634 length:450 start_codon:yes stop_codon:yes gene_type:complete